MVGGLRKELEAGLYVVIEGERRQQRGHQKLLQLHTASQVRCTRCGDAAAHRCMLSRTGAAHSSTGAAHSLVWSCTL